MNHSASKVNLSSSYVYLQVNNELNHVLQLKFLFSVFEYKIIFIYYEIYAEIDHKKILQLFVYLIIYNIFLKKYRFCSKKTYRQKPSMNHHLQN